MDSITDIKRWAEDQCNVVDCLQGQNLKKVQAVYITGDQVQFDDTGASRVVTTQLITIADGYRSYSQGDGFLYPRVNQKSGKVSRLAGAELSHNEVLVGPICFPYQVNTMSGGLDPVAVFQPTVGSIHLQITNIGFPSDISFFSIDEVMLTGKGIQEGISYYLKCKGAEYSPLIVATPSSFGGVGSAGATSATAQGNSALLNTGDVLGNLGLHQTDSGSTYGPFSPVNQKIYLLLQMGTYTFKDQDGFTFVMNPATQISFVDEFNVTRTMYLYESTNLLSATFTISVI